MILVLCGILLAAGLTILALREREWGLALFMGIITLVAIATGYRLRLLRQRLPVPGQPEQLLRAASVADGWQCLIIACSASTAQRPGQRRDVRRCR